MSVDGARRRRNGCATDSDLSSRAGRTSAARCERLGARAPGLLTSGGRRRCDGRCWLLVLVVVSHCRPNIARLKSSFDHLENLADRDSLTLVTQRESAHLREVLERLHADQAALALQPHDRSLILFHESW